MRSLKEIAENDPVLVFGAGGGGDIVGALLVYTKLRDFGAKVYLGALVWERYIIDPHPGPIPLIAFLDIEPLAETLAFASGNSIAIRYGLEIKPQAVRVAEKLGEKVLLLDASRGGEGLKSALLAAKDLLEVKTVIGVDVGGDILAKGNEPELWSPLADAISLYAINYFGEDGLVAVHSPGADGELPEETVLRYISEVSAYGGMIGVTGIDLRDYNMFKRIENEIVTEASKIGYMAFEGYFGGTDIRKGTRLVNVSPYSMVTFILKGNLVYKHSMLANLVKGTTHIGDASKRLNQACVYTEYDLEKDIAMQLERGISVDEIDIRQIRDQGKRRIQKSCATV